jgi:hypothetical protein
MLRAILACCLLIFCVDGGTRFARCSMGFTTSYWQKERWSRRAADTLTSYELCWNPSLGNWMSPWNTSREDDPAAVRLIQQHPVKKIDFGSFILQRKLRNLVEELAHIGSCGRGSRKIVDAQCREHESQCALMLKRS